MPVTKFKHRKSVELPNGFYIKDAEIVKYIDDLGKALMSTFKNLYDDLVLLERFEVVSALPTAGADYRGKTYLLSNAGSDDTLHVCIYEGATDTYDWREVTIS
jgi:hypothetical protein